MSAGEPEGVSAGPEADLRDYVRDLDETNGLVVEFARRYVQAPTPRQLDNLARAAETHLNATGLSLHYIFNLEATVAERIRVANSLLNITSDERARSLNGFLTGESAIPTGPAVEIAVTDPETGKAADLDSIPEEMDFADYEEPLIKALESYAYRLGAEINSILHQAEAKPTGLGTKAREFASEHSAGIAFGLAVGMVAMSRYRK